MRNLIGGVGKTREVGEGMKIDDPQGWELVLQNVAKNKMHTINGCLNSEYYEHEALCPGTILH